jgi:hypothetical protein
MIETRDPRQLRPHKLNKDLPRLGPGMPAFGALIDDIAVNGVKEPLTITPAGEVLDGETRRQAAIAAQRWDVPVVVADSDDVVATVYRRLALQKRLTKGQSAYVLFPMAKPLLEEAKQRRIAQLNKGADPRNPIESVFGKQATFEDFCRAHGFSPDLATQAKTLHLIFSGDLKSLKERNLEGADPAALRGEWEPKILDIENPVGLGAALAGMAGQRATKDREKAPPVGQLELFTETITELGTVFEPKRWTKTRPDDKAEIISAWRRAAAQWPADLRNQLAKALTEDLAAAQAA